MDISGKGTKWEVDANVQHTLVVEVSCDGGRWNGLELWYIEFYVCFFGGFGTSCCILWSPLGGVIPGPAQLGPGHRSH